MNGELLKSSRKKLGWTQKDLADYFKVDQPLIAHWEAERRPIPEGVLRMAKSVRRVKKEDAKKRFKKRGLKSPSRHAKGSSTPVECKKSNQKGYSTTHSTPSLTYFPQGICSPNSQSETFSAYSLLEQENYTFLPPAEGSMERHILDAYIGFKEINKRFPVETDFINGEFREAGKEEVLQYFGNLSNTKRMADRLRRYKSAKRKEEKDIKTFPSPSGEVETSRGDKGFPCPCCGKKWRGADNFYNALRKVIKERLSHIEQNPGSYQIAVLGLMAFLFGTQEVKKLGYDVTELENSDTCFCEGQFKPDWHSSFKTILNNRFLNLLQSTDGQGPEEAIKDCTVAVFGR